MNIFIITFFIFGFSLITMILRPFSSFLLQSQLPGILIGGMITFLIQWLIKYKEEQWKKKELRNDAYMNFLSIPLYKPADEDAFRLATAKILTYGSREVAAEVVNIYSMSSARADDRIKCQTKVKEHILQELKTPTKINRYH
jgi:hypothetical protein